MHTCCLSNRKLTGDVATKKIILTNKIIRQASECDECVAARKSKDFKIESIQRSC